MRRKQARSGKAVGRKKPEIISFLLVILGFALSVSSVRVRIPGRGRLNCRFDRRRASEFAPPAAVADRKAFGLVILTARAASLMGGAMKESTSSKRNFEAGLGDADRIFHRAAVSLAPGR